MRTRAGRRGRAQASVVRSRRWVLSCCQRRVSCSPLSWHSWLRTPAWNHSSSSTTRCTGSSCAPSASPCTPHGPTCLNHHFGNWCLTLSLDVMFILFDFLKERVLFFPRLHAWHVDCFHKRSLSALHADKRATRLPIPRREAMSTFLRIYTPS